MEIDEENNIEEVIIYYNNCYLYNNLMQSLNSMSTNFNEEVKSLKVEMGESEEKKEYEEVEKSFQDTKGELNPKQPKRGPVRS